MVDVQNWMMKKTCRKPPYLMVKTMVSTCFNTDFPNKTRPLRVVRTFRGTHRIPSGNLT
jgi:hypothetical protein